MPPSKEAPPGIVGFWIDFACRWYARQLLRKVMDQEEQEVMEMTHAKIHHGKKAPWQNCFRHH